MHAAGWWRTQETDGTRLPGRFRGRRAADPWRWFDHRIERGNVKHGLTDIRILKIRGRSKGVISISGSTWLMISIMAIMVPLVFLINGFTKHEWLQALFAALLSVIGLNRGRNNHE